VRKFYFSDSVSYPSDKLTPLESSKSGEKWKWRCIEITKLGLLEIERRVMLQQLKG